MRMDCIRMQRSFKPLAVSLAIALLALPAAAAQDQRAEYLDLPPRPQAECARYKLDRLLERLRGKGPAETLQKLAEGRQWLEIAIGKYDSYSLPNPVSPFDKPAEVYAGKGGPAASPLGMMQHAWRALEGMRQLLATRNPSVPSSGVSAAKLKGCEQALNEAADAMQKAVEALEEARKWVEHNDGMFVSMKMPPGFLAGKNPKYRLCFDWLSPGSGELGKSLYVSMERNAQGLAAYDYQQKTVDREKSSLPNLVVVESNRSFPGLHGNWFTYGATWEGKEISCLIYYQADRYFVLEVKYIAQSRLFDEEECEGIIRSIRER